LGVPKISYYGVSYGTLIGQEYAELFPDRVRAMVIDSNMDHSLSTTPFLLTEAATDEGSFDQFEAWCDRDSTCALHAQDVHAIWTELQRRCRHPHGPGHEPGPDLARPHLGRGQCALRSGLVAT